MPRDPASSAGRILIVEDEMMVSMMLQDMLEELGYETLGPATRLEEAVATATVSDISAAVLDINLNGKETYPVAEVLRRRGIPFVFATGYGAEMVSERFPGTPALQKPFQRHELGRALAAVMR
ncbi:MAG TPA: response regulator [Afifellaceae bacterium]|nr:response regulator [Afifellaceae bacterium]